MKASFARAESTSVLTTKASEEMTMTSLTVNPESKMKTSAKLILAALACVMSASCQKDAGLGSDSTTAAEQLTLSTEVSTKTSLNGNEIHWTSDDVIAVFDNTGKKNEFTAAATDGSYAEFEGEVTAGTTSIFAVYPYSLAISANTGILKVTVPGDQTSKAGSFAEEHNISVAKAERTPGTTEVTGLTFKNACALLKFTVPAYLSDVQAVTLSSKSVIAGEMTIDYTGEVPVSSISEEGSKSISMTGEYAAGSTFWFVLAPVTLDGITVDVVTAQGTYSMSTDSQFEMTAGNYRNLGTLELEKVQTTSASALHTYSDGILTGTQVNVSLGIDQTTASYITSLTLQIKNAEGAVLRTLNMDSAADDVTMPADGSWPYLPNGDYTVSGTYTLSGVTEKTIEDIAFSVTEAPVFQLTATVPYTSYDKYLAGDASGANSLNGSTIYNVGAAVTVSDAILNNANYPSLSITDNGAEVSAGNLTGRSWGSHTIKVSYTLDGVTASSEASVHVTGLPYTAAPPTKSGDHPWSENEESIGRHQISWNSDGVKLEGTSLKQVITSPSFHIPANVNVSMTVPVKFYSVCVMYTHAQAELYCRIGGEQVDNKTGAKASSGMNKNKSENYTSQKNGTLTASNNTVEVENAYTMSTAYIYVYSVDLKYR